MATTRKRRRARCSTCLEPLVKGACPKHGKRNPDGTSLSPSRFKGKTFDVDPLRREEVMQLIRACSHRSDTGIRNAAIVATLYRSGIRCSELLDLRPRDIDEASGHLTVQHGKGDKRRTVGIDEDALTLIRRWGDRRRRRGIGHHRPLFCTLEGGRIDSAYIRELLPRLGKAAGIDRRVHAHALRHAHAYELAVMEKLPLPVIQQQLGHSSAAVTSIYLQHVAPADVIAAIGARPGWLEE